MSKKPATKTPAAKPTKAQKPAAKPVRKSGRGR